MDATSTCRRKVAGVQVMRIGRRHNVIALTAALFAPLSITACTAASKPVQHAVRPASPSTSARIRSSQAHLSTSPGRAATPAPGTTNPDGLSDEQLVGQLFVSYVYGTTSTPVTPAQRQANLELYGEPTPAAVLQRWHLGGIILIDHNNLDPSRPYLSTGNVDGPSQIAQLTRGLQQVAKADTGLELLIGTDQEGGQVQRITNGVSWRPAEEQLGTDGADQLRCSYRVLGQQLRSLGVNQDYAPVADVVRTSGGIIGDRSFGPDPAVDARDVVAAVNGLQSAGVLATLKHWPGHGSTPVDSHESLPRLSMTAAQWRAVDRSPFQAAASSAGSIMVGHLALPSIDPSGRPATLSPTLVTGQLRQGLHFTGLILTDSLWMAPMLQAGTPAQVAVQAVRAGDDMLLESPDLPAAWNTVLKQIHIDPGFRSQVRAAVQHILAAKARAATVPANTAGC
jgi:beta-N-acetylhexosaminidase